MLGTSKKQLDMSQYKGKQWGHWHSMKDLGSLEYLTVADLAGRVKTLHPGVHGGILAKRDEASHMDALHKHKLNLIDVVRSAAPERTNLAQAKDRVFNSSSRHGVWLRTFEKLRHLLICPGLSSCIECKSSVPREPRKQLQLFGGILPVGGGGGFFALHSEIFMHLTIEAELGSALQVVANLYPFRQTVTASQAPSYEVAVENIDIGDHRDAALIPIPCKDRTSDQISMSGVLPGKARTPASRLFAAGGPAMIRAAAKNHAHVSVCVESSDYDELLLVLGGSQEGPEAVAYRKRLAWKAYQHCASYDTAVADWLWQQVGEQFRIQDITVLATDWETSLSWTEAVLPPRKIKTSLRH